MQNYAYVFTDLPPKLRLCKIVTVCFSSKKDNNSNNPPGIGSGQNFRASYWSILMTDIPTCHVVSSTCWQNASQLSGALWRGKYVDVWQSCFSFLLYSYKSVELNGSLAFQVHIWSGMQKSATPEGTAVRFSGFGGNACTSCKTRALIGVWFTELGRNGLLLLHGEVL